MFASRLVYANCNRMLSAQSLLVPTTIVTSSAIGYLYSSCSNSDITKSQCDAATVLPNREYLSEHATRKQTQEDVDKVSRSNILKEKYQPSSKHYAIGEGATLRKRMTSIGRFSLISETIQNPSTPTFFIALAGHSNQQHQQRHGNRMSSTTLNNSDETMSLKEFQSLWKERDIDGRHERFQCRVSKHDDRFFEPAMTRFTDHVKESLHYFIYRSELQRRIEGMLSGSLDVTSKLWEAQISSGALGSSGALSKHRVREIQQRDPSVTKETVVVFRAHHALADGVSMGVAISDLSDEAEDLRNDVAMELVKMRDVARRRRRSLHPLQRFALFLRRVFGFWFLGTLRALAYHFYLVFVSSNPFNAVYGQPSYSKQVDTATINGNIRSVSWAEAATVNDVKRVARTIHPNATVNDVFVSCASYAVTKQLQEYEQLFSLNKGDNPIALPTHINVVIPVHLRGGLVPPGESMGNKIGAMIARIPACIGRDSSSDSELIEKTASGRLILVSDSLANAKRAPTPFLAFQMAKFCSNYLPDTVANFLLKKANANASLVVTNVRGPIRPLHWHGRTVEAIGGFIPLPPGLPVGVVVQSYAGIVSLSVTADKVVVSDADKFLSWMLDEYQTLCLEAASKQVARCQPT